MARVRSTPKEKWEKKKNTGKKGEMKKVKGLRR